jgi:hypothetical protein
MNEASLYKKTVVDLRKIYRDKNIRSYNNNILAGNLNKDGLVAAILKFNKVIKSPPRRNKSKKIDKNLPKKSRKSDRRVSTPKTMEKTKKTTTRKTATKTATEESPQEYYTRAELRKMKVADVRVLYASFYGTPEKRVNKPEMMEALVGKPKNQPKVSPKVSPKKSPKVSPKKLPKSSSEVLDIPMKESRREFLSYDYVDAICKENGDIIVNSGMDFSSFGIVKGLSPIQIIPNTLPMPEDDDDEGAFCIVLTDWGSVVRIEADGRIVDILNSDMKHISSNREASLMMMVDNEGFVWARDETRTPEEGGVVFQIDLENIVSTSVGKNYVTYLTAKGEVYRQDIPRYLDNGDRRPLRLTKPGLLSIKNIKATAVGDDHILLLNKEGEVYSLGNNKYGQLGLGDNKSRLNSEKIDNLPKINRIYANRNHSVCVGENGHVYVFGENKYNILGVNPETLGYNPTPIQIPEIDNVLQAGILHVGIRFVTRNGDVYTTTRGMKPGIKRINPEINVFK